VPPPGYIQGGRCQLRQLEQLEPVKQLLALRRILAVVDEALMAEARQAAQSNRLEAY